MFFTQEDYKKIYEWISRNSIRDTEFNEALTPLNETDTITLVQNGVNVRVSLKDLIDQLFLMGVSDFLNITDKFGEKNITLDQAIELIPYTARKVGQVITFLDTNNKWKIYQFRGELTQWDQLNLWEDILDIEAHTINSILPDEEDLTKTLPDDKGNSYLSLKDREYNPEDFSGLGMVILRKNIVEIEDPIYGKVKKNVLYQDMINKENTIYEIRYDFDLNGQTITIPKNCKLVFSGSISNGSIVLTNTKIESNQICFNNIILEGETDTLKLNWFDNIDKFIVSFNKLKVSNVILNQQSYYPTEIINKNINSDITIHGQNCVLNYTYNSNYGGGTLIRISNSTFNNDISQTMISPIHKGDTQTTSSIAKYCKEGDTLLLRDHNTSSFFWKRDYQQGEYIKVRRIEGETIIFENAVCGEYKNIDNGKCIIYKVNFVKADINNLTINLSNNKNENSIAGIQLFGVSSQLSNIKVNGFARGIIISNSINSNLENLIITNASTVNDTLNNSLTIFNSQHITVRGGQFFGGYNGITVSTTTTYWYDTISRFVYIKEVEASSNNYQIGIDSHENVEYITVEKSRVDKINLGGCYNIIKDNIVTGRITLNGPRSFTNSIINNKCGDRITLYHNSVTQGLTSFNFWTPDTNLEVCNIIGNTVSSITVGAHFDRESDYPNYKNIVINIKDNQILNSIGIDAKFGDKTLQNNALHCYLINNIITHQLSNIFAQYVIIDGNIITPDNKLVLIADNIIIKNNTFQNSGHTYAGSINADVACPTNFILENNIFIESGGFTYDATSNFSTTNTISIKNNTVSNTHNMYIFYANYQQQVNAAASIICNSSKGIACYINGFYSITTSNNSSLRNGSKVQFAYDIPSRYVNYLDYMIYSGSSKNRPINGYGIGSIYYDTDLNKPIFVKKINIGDQYTWVDASGIVVE